MVEQSKAGSSAGRLEGPEAPHPRRPRHRSFEFRTSTLSGRTISLAYALTGGPDPDVQFTEVLELPPELPAPDAADPAVRALLDGIHRVFGVSYYKAAVPRRIVAPPVSRADAAFWSHLYTEGLGEFYYRNDLFPDHEGFPVGEVANVAPGARPAASPTREERALVLVGGGKDSAVTREVLRHAGVAATGFSLGSSAWLSRSVGPMGVPHLSVRRRLDPRLRELNERGAWNGHVPISACIAFVATLVAHLAGDRWIAAGNERSADEGNVTWRGMQINHQWSKSLGFEEQFGAWCERHLPGGPAYFSVLRPLGELRIAEAFSHHPRYFRDFTSCNRNFRQLPNGEESRWCGRCPKCVFVYLILAPSLDDGQLRAIFEGDFLAPAENRDLLEQLAGLAKMKPFECVGTFDETRAALGLLARKGRLPESLRSWYASNLAPLAGDAEATLAALRSSDAPNRLPAGWKERLDAYLAAH
ncbi:MAG TPA: hypothetical protein VHV30_04430 [Polyangiaceae bacterium]|nr:hypothetical protein [Polyangiaceae bacterium]